MCSILICLPPTGITSDIFSWICWKLWTARNRLIFEDRRSSASCVATNALSNAREWSLAQTTANNPPRKSTPSPPLYELPVSTVLCNTDSAWISHSKKAGLGWILGTPNTSSYLQGSKSYHFVPSSLLAEALALREELRAAEAANLTNDWM
ncbi:hypothetical protein Bca101_055030 [Brassica carinata]